MASGRTRSTRRLRSWIVEQVSSGKYPGLVWDDQAKTMFRIPWKHAGKQDFRKDEDGAIFKAWAAFKGKGMDSGGDPASCKTRLRCALNKSTEFEEVPDRGQLDISEPYKVYRLVPLSEQGLMAPDRKCKQKPAKRSKRKSSESNSDAASPLKHIKEEVEMAEDQVCAEDDAQAQQLSQHSATMRPQVMDELRLDVRIECEESVAPPPAEGQDSFLVQVHYLGQEVAGRLIQGTDVRITYLPSSITPPTPAPLREGFPRVPLPEPPALLPAGEELQALSTLLPYMEKGVLLTSAGGGVYGRRYCRGRVFWTGPHSTSPGPHKMERNADPVMLFSKDAFRHQLEQFRLNGGAPPQCSFTLCFGEELSKSEDPASKLIIAQVSLPWAELQVRSVASLLESITILQTLASQSPLGEITLSLVAVPPSET
ncbi:interferon regulatory factor 9 [Genypterus blacodes]|uniref:interferon regulatory factor 9 n=1 Tax=Genypterus blacodes TaxID=154954 RepID=UPI003F76AF40